MCKTHTSNSQLFYSPLNFGPDGLDFEFLDNSKDGNFFHIFQCD